MSKKAKDETEEAQAPAPTGPRIASVYLVQPLHLRTKVYDGTISPETLPDQADIELYDEGRFLQVRRPQAGRPDIVRNVPWAHVRHWTPMGAE